MDNFSEQAITPSLLFPSIRRSCLFTMRAGALSLVALAAPLIQGHYIFSQLIVDGQAVGSDYTYIRKNSNTYMPVFPAEIIDSEELRCNKGAKPGTAQTYTVKAGSKIGFKLAYNEFSKFLT